VTAFRTCSGFHKYGRGLSLIICATYRSQSSCLPRQVPVGPASCWSLLMTRVAGVSEVPLANHRQDASPTFSRPSSRRKWPSTRFPKFGRGFLVALVQSEGHNRSPWRLGRTGVSAGHSVGGNDRPNDRRGGRSYQESAATANGALGWTQVAENVRPYL